MKSCFNKHEEVRKHINFKRSTYKLENYTRIKLRDLNGTKELSQFINLLIEDLSIRTKTEPLQEIFEYLNVEFSKDNYQIVKIEHDSNFRLYSLDDSMVSYGCYFKEQQKGQFVLINDHCDKCINKIKGGDYSGAITNSRSLLEQILREIQIEMNPTSRRGYNGDLKRLLEDVLKRLDITSGLREKSQKGYQKLQDGFVEITEGISMLRHGMSDAHNISYSPTQKDALLAVNTSKTLANFIVEHYFEKHVPMQGAA